MMPDILQTARAELRYDSESGNFYRLHRRSSKTGDDLRAGTLLQGYIIVWVGGRSGRRFRAHRLAWLFMTGSFPPKGQEIDHINGDRSDNRWVNLRLVTRTQNNMNRGVQCNNKSGQTGVSYQRLRDNWTARIVVDRRPILLGDFPTKEQAIAARLDAEIRYFGKHAPQSQRSAIPRGSHPGGFSLKEAMP